VGEGGRGRSAGKPPAVRRASCALAAGRFCLGAPQSLPVKFRPTVVSWGGGEGGSAGDTPALTRSGRERERDRVGERLSSLLQGKCCPGAMLAPPAVLSSEATVSKGGKGEGLLSVISLLWLFVLLLSLSGVLYSLILLKLRLSLAVATSVATDVEIGLPPEVDLLRRGADFDVGFGTVSGSITVFVYILMKNPNGGGGI
jgi:hypothetical protein